MTTEALDNPFVKDTVEGESTTITAEEMIALLASLKFDHTDKELQELLDQANAGQAIEREVFMNIIHNLLENGQDDLEELDAIQISLAH